MAVCPTNLCTWLPAPENGILSTVISHVNVKPFWHLWSVSLGGFQANRGYEIHLSVATHRSDISQRYCFNVIWHIITRQLVEKPQTSQLWRIFLWLSAPLPLNHFSIRLLSDQKIYFSVTCQLSHFYYCYLVAFEATHARQRRPAECTKTFTINSWGWNIAILEYRSVFCDSFINFIARPRFAKVLQPTSSLKRHVSRVIEFFFQLSVMLNKQKFIVVVNPMEVTVDLSDTNVRYIVLEYF